MTDGRRGDTRVAADIAEYGWHGIHVTDRADALDPDPHIWSYSIGLLETWQHPELVIFGLPRDTAHQILWNAVHEIEVGCRFSSLDRWEAFENGYEATFLEVDPRWLPFLGQALDYHGSDFPALQIAGWIARRGGGRGLARDSARRRRRPRRALARRPPAGAASRTPRDRRRRDRPSSRTGRAPRRIRAGSP
jgi:hypothetical protein